MEKKICYSLIFYYYPNSSADNSILGIKISMNFKIMRLYKVFIFSEITTV